MTPPRMLSKVRWLAALGAVLVAGAALAQEDTSQTIGPKLRRLAFETKPEKLEFRSDDEFPKVYGILMDWPVDGQVASVVSMRDGTASLYTTASKGVIGGHSLPAAKEAAIQCTRTAAHFLDTAAPAKDFPYPKPGEVFFYFLTYDGVHFASAKEEDLLSEKDSRAVLFAWAQRVLTELLAKN